MKRKVIKAIWLDHFYNLFYFTDSFLPFVGYFLLLTNLPLGGLWITSTFDTNIKIMTPKYFLKTQELSKKSLLAIITFFLLFSFTTQAQENT
jgi:hypothetical protein